MTTTTKSTKAPVQEPPASSKLLQCSAHGQTLQMVRGHWDTVALMDRTETTDVTFCACCSAPAKYPGINAMSLTEIARLTPLCSRCVTKQHETTTVEDSK